MSTLRAEHRQVEFIATQLRFYGCDEVGDESVSEALGHSGFGFYVHCSEYPEDGSTFLGTDAELVEIAKCIVACEREASLDAAEQQIVSGLRPAWTGLALRKEDLGPPALTGVARDLYIALGSTEALLDHVITRLQRHQRLSRGDQSQLVSRYCVNRDLISRVEGGVR